MSTERREYDKSSYIIGVKDLNLSKVNYGQIDKDHLQVADRRDISLGGRPRI